MRIPSEEEEEEAKVGVQLGPIRAPDHMCPQGVERRTEGAKRAAGRKC